MGNPNHNPAGPGGGQFASGQTSTGVTNTVRERQAMRAMVDKRKFAQGRTSNRNLAPTPSLATRFARHQAGGGGGGGGGQGGGQSGGMGAHMRGVHNATHGKNLAEASAVPTQQTIEKKPTQFAETANAKPARR